MKKYITSEQAISILPDGETVHTFLNLGFGLMGADWSREDIIEKLRKSDVLELTGEMARKMEHGLVAYDKTAKTQGDLLFIETDEEKLVALEKTLEEGKKDDAE